MKVFVSLVAVVVLFLLALLGAQVEQLQLLFGVVVPYLAMGVFLVGFSYRIIDWARSAVPFRIPTTCGQQKSLPWIKTSRYENPHDVTGVVGRMALEVLAFRSLFRNTRMEFRGERQNAVVYAPSKWLWFFALAFHWSFLIIFVRHMRFFSEPVPSALALLQTLDGFFEVGVPTVFVTSFVFIGAVGFLLVRRFVTPQLRYISLPGDYFPLFLLIGIGASGVFLRHITKTDVVGVKELAMGLLRFDPVIPAGIDPMFYAHLFLVSALFAYFPFSKLVHMGGVFLSPTRNLANNNRAKRHVNPWNHPVKVHTYEEYEEEFRDKMKAVGIPLEKE
jgi:nitrate reductase gamma subunit